jgi:hypothetical protein
MCLPILLKPVVRPLVSQECWYTDAYATTQLKT